MTSDLYFRDLWTIKKWRTELQKMQSLSRGLILSIWWRRLSEHGFMTANTGRKSALDSLVGKDSQQLSSWTIPSFIASSCKQATFFTRKKRGRKSKEAYSLYRYSGSSLLCLLCMRRVLLVVWSRGCSPYGCIESQWPLCKCRVLV